MNDNFFVNNGVVGTRMLIQIISVFQIEFTEIATRIYRICCFKGLIYATAVKTAIPETVSVLTKRIRAS